MSYIPAIYGKVDLNNSSTTPLLANATFTGATTDVTNYISININITVDQSSSINGLTAQFSTNGTNWTTISTKSIIVLVGGTSMDYNLQLDVINRYFRVVYVNGATNQGVFRLQTVLNAQSVTSSLSATTKGLDLHQVPLTCTSEGFLDVNIASGLTAFGDSRVVQLDPLIQFNFCYGLNTNIVNTATATGGTVTSTNQLAVATTTTTSGSSASFSSKKFFRYREGMGGLARFTALFSAGKANNNQIAGCGDTDNGYFFGYNGTSFGILYRRNLVDTWIPQTSWNRDTMLGTGGSTNASNYLLDPTKGNIFQISFGYLGFANILFYIFNPYTSSYTLVHVYLYAGLNTVPIVTNPNMSLFWNSINSGTTASSTAISAGSGALFIDGKNINEGSIYGRSNFKVNPGTASLNIITLRNNTTINGVTNRSQISISSISFSTIDTTASNNAAVMILNLVLNPTVGGTPAYTNIDATNSLAAFDVAGTTVTGGTIVRSFSACYTSSITINFKDNEIILFPSDRLTFASTLSASTTNTRANVSVNWIEYT